MKNLASATPVRMHGSYGVAAHDKRRKPAKRRPRWETRITDGQVHPVTVRHI